jgi:capsular polysaccharide biosynthesis protein
MEKIRPKSFVNYILLFDYRGIIYNYSLINLSLVGKKRNFIGWSYFKKIKYIKNFNKIKILCNNNSLILFDQWSSNAYHFHVELLSKLFYFSQNNNLDKYILFLPRTDFMVKIELGLKTILPQSCISIKWIHDNILYVNLGRNIYITNTSVGGSNNPDYMKLIRKNLFNFFALTSHENREVKFKRIYCVRTGGNRIVINDFDVIALLKKYEFYCVKYEELTYFETITLMSNANILIGLHGAGLTNCIFMPVNSKLIEFRTTNDNPSNHCYWHLGQSCNLDYYIFKVESVDGTELEGSNACNVHVNLEELENYLRLL